MKHILDMQVNLGFRIIEKTKSVKVWEAEEILMSKKQRYYTKAIKDGEDAKLMGYYIVCPYCNSEFALNTRCLNFINQNCGNGNRISGEAIKKWSSLQVTFFDDSTLRISSPAEKPSSFKCPKCENVSKDSEKKRYVKISLIRKKIEIRSEVANIGEILSFKWLDKWSIPTATAIYEVLTFNLKKGKVHIRLEDSSGKILYIKDVTSYPEKLSGCIAYRLINYNKFIKRKIRKMFETVWDSSLPYYDASINIRNLIKMTMFIGYGKEFYYGIPYEYNTMRIEHSFRARAERMHNLYNLVKVFEKSGLPDVKSVRRQFFGNPSLFFYINEAELVYKAIKDVNIFCKFLGSIMVYEVLSAIHMRPGIMEYINDFCEIKGARRLLQDINESWKITLSSAIDYCCANESLKKAMQENWLGLRSIGRIIYKKPLHSIPVKNTEEKIVDCNIYGYDFFWLRSSNEYETAAKQLNNCLSTWNVFNYPVVCVKKQEKYVAAIELSEGKILQARAPNNSLITAGSRLEQALERWRKKYHLEWGSEIDCEDDIEEFLPVIL